MVNGRDDCATREVLTTQLEGRQVLLERIGRGDMFFIVIPFDMFGIRQEPMNQGIAPES